jgi:hypothetical protein
MSGDGSLTGTMHLTVSEECICRSRARSHLSGKCCQALALYNAVDVRTLC